MIIATMDSPVGVLTLHSDGEALTGLEFENPKYPLAAAPRGNDRVLDAARKQLDQYFAGKRKSFDIAVAPSGTAFQQRVWRTLQRIQFGDTWSYGRLANAIGNPAASRAVGLANGRNPIAIVIPCHRVIGADGSLTGFGGGIERKRWLLEHEGRGALLRC